MTSNRDFSKFLTRWSDKIIPDSPFQSLEWFRSSEVFDRMKIFPVELGDSAAFVPAWCLRNREHYYHNPYNLFCGIHESPFIQRANISNGSSLPWGRAVVTVSPYGYLGGPTTVGNCSNKVLLEMADKILDYAKEKGASMILSHFLYEDKDNAWIKSLIEKGGIPIVMGAHSSLNLMWGSMKEYFQWLGSSRRSLRSDYNKKVGDTAIECIIQEESGYGPGQENAVELLSRSATRFDDISPPLNLIKKISAGEGFNRLLFTIRTPGKKSRSALVVLKNGKTLYPKFYGSREHGADYFTLVFYKLIQYAMTNGYQTIEYGGASHQAKLFRGAQLKYAIGVLIVLKKELINNVQEIADTVSRAKLKHFHGIATKWHVGHEPPKSKLFNLKN